MTDLLPVIFTKGQNEGIDPRVAPSEVLNVAQNVRWRKDGRPAKRYGLTAITTTGFDSGGSLYGSFPVNFIGQWRGAPIMAAGAGVRRLIGTKWSDITEANALNLPHFVPGRHDPIARSESVRVINPSVAVANEIVLHAWEESGLGVCCSVAKTTGEILIARKIVTPTASFPRVVAVGSLFHVVQMSGANVITTPFDPATMTFGGNTVIAVASAATNTFDAFSRGADWLLAYQSAPAILSILLLSSAAAPVTLQVRTAATTAAPGDCRIAVTGNATSAVFVAWLEPNFGTVKYSAFNNAMTAVTAAPLLVETVATNSYQPSLCVSTAPFADLFWGGVTNAAPLYNYTRLTQINSAGAVGTITTYPHLCPRSKPFLGPNNGSENLFIWMSTASSSANPGFDHADDQDTLFLMFFGLNVASRSLPIAHLWTPGVSDAAEQGAPFAAYHMSDAVTDGVTYFSSFSVTLAVSVTGPGGTPNIGIDSFSYYNTLTRQREAALDLETAGRALQISGGVLREFTGATEESGFMRAPVIATALATAGGALTNPGTYLYVAVYEWMDLQGRRHRSAPSDPVSISTTAPNKTGTLTIATLPGFARNGTISSVSIFNSQPVIHIYRTLAGGTTYHRVTPSGGAPSASPIGNVPYVVYADALSDAIAATQEFVYTDGGVVPNIYPPPCTFLALCNARLWLGGQFDRNVITASKLLVDSEPTQFSDEAEFSVFLPEECTGLASIDGTVVAFARESIYLVNGDGPSDQGVGSFNPPQKLPSEVGCIDWRSVVETSLGVFFQSKRGIYLLPRGFNTPIFIGAEIEDTLSQFPEILSATVVVIPSAGGSVLGEATVRFVASLHSGDYSSVVLVYDLRTGGWSVDFASSLGAAGRSGTWFDEYVMTGANSSTGVFNGLWAETPGTWGDDGVFTQTLLGTGDIRPFGVTGYGAFKRVVIVGEYRGASNVGVSVSVDGRASDISTFSVTTADQSDGVVYLDVTPKYAKGSSIRVLVTDTSLSGPTEGFIAQAIMIESELIERTKRLALGRKA